MTLDGTAASLGARQAPALPLAPLCVKQLVHGSSSGLPGRDPGGGRHAA
jgi:hypothetical protein